MTEMNTAPQLAPRERLARSQPMDNLKKGV